MGGQTFDMWRRSKEGLLTGDDLLNATYEGWPLFSWEIKFSQVKDDSLARSFWGSNRLHEAVVGKGFIISRVFLSNFPDEHKKSIAQAGCLVRSITIVWGTTFTIQIHRTANSTHRQS